LIQSFELLCEYRYCDHANIVYVLVPADLIWA